MIGYWILLLIIAFIAYNFGSISTLNIASVFVFHRDLHRIGKKSMFISNFRRLFGYTGFLKLLLVELIRDFVPILLGGILMSFKEHADIGMAFAGFCLVLGRLFPVFNRFRGSYATILKNLPAIPRISKKKEMRMSLEEDISYKFDETF